MKKWSRLAWTVWGIFFVLFICAFFWTVNELNNGFEAAVSLTFLCIVFGVFLMGGINQTGFYHYTLRGMWLPSKLLTILVTWLLFEIVQMGMGFAGYEYGETTDYVVFILFIMFAPSIVLFLFPPEKTRTEEERRLKTECSAAAPLPWYLRSIFLFFTIAVVVSIAVCLINVEVVLGLAFYLFSMFAIHVWWLTVPGQTTYRARLFLPFYILATTVVFETVVVVPRQVAGAEIAKFVITGMFLSLPLLAVLSYPCRLLGALLLIIPYGACLLMVSPFTCLFGGIAYLYFPFYRRLGEFMRPTRLPYLPSRRGLTLIELLIVIAITAIMTTYIANGLTVNTRLSEYSRMRRAAAAVAEEQIDLLRVRGTLPSMGDYPIDSSLQSRYGKLLPSDGAHYTVSPGPSEKVREISVKISIKAMDGDMSRTMTYTALLPVEEVRL